MSAVKLLPERIEGRHVLYALFAFFGVMFIANGIFLYYAVGTFNGFETSDAYREGLSYNKRIASDKAQISRGWKSEVQYNYEQQKLVVEIRDRRGQGVAGLAIKGELRHPVSDKDDQLLILQEIAPARYATSLKLPAGQWIFAAEITKRGETAYRFKKRLWVKESR